MKAREHSETTKRDRSGRATSIAGRSCIEKRGYILQAVVIPAWWISMVASDQVYTYFYFPGITRSGLLRESYLVPSLTAPCGAYPLRSRQLEAF